MGSWEVREADRQGQVIHTTTVKIRDIKPPRLTPTIRQIEELWNTSGRDRPPELPQLPEIASRFLRHDRYMLIRSFHSSLATDSRSGLARGSPDCPFTSTAPDLLPYPRLKVQIKCHTSRSH